MFCLAHSFQNWLKRRICAYNKWNIVGNPNLSLILNDMHGDITTTSCMINRIPDILNAKAGFITVNDLPVPCYKTLVTNNNE